MSDNLSDLPKWLEYVILGQGAVITALAAVAAVFFKRTLSRIDKNETENAAMKTAQSELKQELAVQHQEIDNIKHWVKDGFDRVTSEQQETNARLNQTNQNFVELIQLMKGLKPPEG